MYTMTNPSTCEPCPGSQANRVDATQPCNRISGEYDSSCLPGYWEDSNKICQNCLKDCQQCSNGTSCDTCGSGFEKYVGGGSGEICYKTIVIQTQNHSTKKTQTGFKFKCNIGFSSNSVTIES